MKLFQFPFAPLGFARLFPVSARTALRLLWCSLSLSGSTLLAAAPAQPQTFHLPLTFEQNRGQAPKEVKWLGQGSSYRVLFDGDGATFLLPDKNNTRAMVGRRPVPVDRSFQMKYSVMRMKLAGGRPWKDISGVEPTGGVSNYQSPADLKSWISNVPQYRQVKVANVYEGIDLILYTHGNDLEYDFVVAPGADPKQVQVVFEGVKGMRVDDKSGDLVLTAPDGSELRQFRPKVYQQIAHKRVEVAGGYQLLGQGRAAFTLAAYDRRRALVIDPKVDFTTFYGGSSGDVPLAIAVDDDGNSYITGYTSSTNFPVTNTSTFQYCHSFDFAGFCATGPNIFAAKLDPTGKVVFASYGGLGSGAAIALDSTGVYVTGEVFPPDGDNVIGYSDNNNGDTLVWRMESQGGLQDYYQVLGGEGTDYGSAIGLDSMHNVWVAGATYSGGASSNASSGDVDIFELAPDGGFKHDYRFGSNGEDVAYGMTIGPATADRPWVTGKTCGNGFPTTDGISHQMSHCGVFVLVLENSGVQKLGMVFGGGDGDDEGDAIASDGSEDAYIAGRVNSTNFPTTQGAFQTLKTEGPQAFVAQVDSASSAGLLVHSTLFSADGTTVPYAVANNDGRGVYLTGSTSSVHLPGGPVLTPNPTAGFVTKFSVDLSQLRYTQLLGLDVSGIALRKTVPDAPEIYTTGSRFTGGSDYDHEDAFVVKLEEGTPTSSITNLPSQMDGPSFTVSWSGSDPSDSIASYDVFVSDNGGAFTAFQTGTSATSATFTGMTGHTYGFFSIATDTAGNTEPIKTAPDAVVAVGPPAITCTGCMFMTNGSRAALAFNVSTKGSGSTFTFNNGNATQPVRFASSSISQISVTGSFATFSGEGAVNGQAGYTFTVSATDGGGAGSGLDTVLVQLSGPNNFTYNAPATIAGGDVVVRP
jgi:Beta-propeller repeat